MAYSRWSGREGWYVFWETGHDEPTLAMWLGLTTPGDDNVRYYSATHRQLDGIEVRALTALVPEASPAEVAELMEYVREFCADVREQNAG